MHCVMDVCGTSKALIVAAFVCWSAGLACGAALVFHWSRRP